MIIPAQIDDQLGAPDRLAAEFDAVREQLNLIEAALPDYGPSFSALEQQTRQIKTAIDKIAASPSVALSADQHAAKSARAVSEFLAPLVAQLQKAVEGTDARQAELIRLTNTLRVRSMDRPYLWVWPTLALMAGFWLYPLIAAAVPGGTHLAALAMGHRDRWVAGDTLMSTADPASHAANARASHIFVANRDAFERCQAQADRAKKAQPCIIQLAPSDGQR